MWMVAFMILLSSTHFYAQGRVSAQDFLASLAIYFWFHIDDFIEWNSLRSLCIQTPIFPLEVLATALFLHICAKQTAHLNSEYSSILEGCGLCQGQTWQWSCVHAREKGSSQPFLSFLHFFTPDFHGGWYSWKSNSFPLIYPWITCSRVDNQLVLCMLEPECTGNCYQPPKVSSFKASWICWIAAGT